MRTRKGFTLRPLGNEYILVADGLETIDFSCIISMNESSAFLWEEVTDKEFDADTLVDLLVSDYDISRETAEHDVALMLQSWKKANIIED